MQETGNTILVVMAYYRRGRGPDFSYSIGWSIGLIGAGKHAQVIVAVTKSDHSREAELLA